MDTKYNPPIDISHTQTEKPFRMKHTIKNPNFFVIDKISNYYIANHKKKNLFLFQCDSKIIFHTDFLKPIPIETDFYHNTSLINLKRCLFYEIDNFIEKGYKFSHIDEMNITTINDKMFMAYDYYVTRPRPAVEIKLNMIISKNPHPIKSTNRSHLIQYFENIFTFVKYSF